MPTTQPPTERPDLRDALAESALRVAILYAGTGNREKPDGGLQALGKYLEDSVPESERERASEVLLRILNGILFELTQQLRSQAQLPPLQVTPETQRFMAQAVFALSDAQYYPAPATFMLEDLTKCKPASSKWPAHRERRWCTWAASSSSLAFLACSTCAIGACGSGWPLKPRPPKTPMPPWPCRVTVSLLILTANLRN